MKTDKIIWAIIALAALGGLGYLLYNKQMIHPSILQCLRLSKKDCLTCCEKTISKDEPVELSRCVNACIEDISTTMGD